MILLNVLLILLVIIGIGVFIWSARTFGLSPRVDPLADHPETYDPLRIGVGDIVTYAGVDHVVGGTITFDQEDFRWHEHLLDGSTGRRRLTVEYDEGELEMTLWTPREGTGLEPGGDVILDDRVYRCVRSGSARFTAEGATGTASSGSMDYADYATDDQTGLLAFERCAKTASWTVSTVRAVTRVDLTVVHSGPAV